MKKVLLVIGLMLSIYLVSNAQSVYEINYVFTDTADWQPSRGMLTLNGNVLRYNCEGDIGVFNVDQSTMKEYMTNDSTPAVSWVGYHTNGEDIAIGYFTMVFFEVNTNFIFKVGETEEDLKVFGFNCKVLK